MRRALALLFWPVRWVVTEGGHRREVHVSHWRRRVVRAPGSSAADIVAQFEGVANYQLISKMLKTDGGISVFFGLLALGVAGDTLAPGLTRNVAAASGFALLIAGIWMINHPRPVALLVDGIATVIIGVWMVALGAHASAGSVLPVYGLIQVVVGIEKGCRYLAVSQAWVATPSPQQLAALNETLEAVAEHPDVDFSAHDYVRRMQWAGQLSDGYAVFVRSRAPALFVLREDVVIANARKKRRRSGITAKLRIRGSQYIATFDPHTFKRLSRWTHGSSLRAAAAV